MLLQRLLLHQLFQSRSAGERQHCSRAVSQLLIPVFAPVRLLTDLTINDIDSAKISEIRLETSGDGDVIVVPDLYGFSAQSNSGGTIVIWLK